MRRMGAFFAEVWDHIVKFFSSYNYLIDTLDILLVAFAIYSLIKLVRDSRAEQLLKGLCLLGIAYGMAHLLQLTTLKYLLKIVFDNALIVLVVIFQPEIRRALEQAGHSRIGKLNLFGGSDEENERYVQSWQRAISAVCGAVSTLQQQKMGALVVFERTTKLGEIIKTGTVLNADINVEAIGTIFSEGTPLHDGAVIVRDARIKAAGCVLPLSANQDISKDMGTRHRAALGMSENSDALCVVVSEETGIISMAKNGVLIRRLDRQNLYNLLQMELVPDPPEEEETKPAKLLRMLHGTAKKEAAGDEQNKEK